MTSSDSTPTPPKRSILLTGMKLVLSATFLYAAFMRLAPAESNNDHGTDSSSIHDSSSLLAHRRLAEQSLSYMEPLLEDLEDRKKLFRESPPQEVKYWFEYSGPLQKYYYRFSKRRGKADYFEGRDDSGIVSARFVPGVGGTKEYQQMFLSPKSKENSEIQNVKMRLYENCLALGSSKRPNTSRGTNWDSWYGKTSGSQGSDRCRILFTMNTVGAGRGTTMLWETNPPVAHAEEPPRWVSEQETASTHLERNLKEINAMCQTGLIAARVQILVCENISPKWIEWMDSLLVDCGGRPWKLTEDMDQLENRPSPVQIVVSSTSQTAETCHDLKSGFMEQRAQDLIFAHSGDTKSSGLEKTTDPALVSSDEHDLYVSMKWNTLVTIRAVSSFLQASADLAAAAASPVEKSVPGGPASDFLIPSFVQVSYVSEENAKVAKWRMHGDFFHPAAWEICKDSFESTWIPHSLSGSGGVGSMCPSGDSNCGQWWVYFTEFQMPTTPAVFANEAVPPPVQGGSNAFWMVTERHRKEYVKGALCRENKEGDCSREAQAVIPLGDLESFLINFTPNTALGKKHLEGRRPGYTKADELAKDRERVRQREQLEDEDIESALFDYTIYPAALFHKDATIKAVRKRDFMLTGKEDYKNPQQIKSSYYDITITKPRPPVMGWCQALARKGLCTLYADYFRSSEQCREACGMQKDFSPKDYEEHVDIGTDVVASKQ